MSQGKILIHIFPLLIHWQFIPVKYKARHTILKIRLPETALYIQVLIYSQEFLSAPQSPLAEFYFHIDNLLYNISFQIAIPDFLSVFPFSNRII